MRPSNNNRNKKSRRKISRPSSSVASGNDFDITNNAFASAILEDDFSAVGSGVHLREELVNSIMTHEAAVYDEQRNQQLDRDQSKLARARESFQDSGKPVASSGIDDGDNFSFRPLPPSGNMMDQSVADHQSLAQSVRSGRSARSGQSGHPSSSRAGSKVPPSPPPQQRMPSKKGSFMSVSSKANSIFNSGLSSIKGQVTEIDKVLLQRANSEKSDANYGVPLPQLPYESRRAGIVRLVIALMCMVFALTITLVWGQGRFGLASSNMFYHSFVRDEDMDGPLVLNDDTSKDGSHLFEKVESLERSFPINAFGDPKHHMPIVTVESDGSIEVKASSEMSGTVEFIWVKEVARDKVVLARHFSSDEKETPILRAKVPIGVVLKAYIFCNVHELWSGEEFDVQSGGN
jgi:desulfoferrodoxin (superoxide reductase-like protein)